MARNTLWHDDYWLMLMQVYLQRPVGVKPLYSRNMVELGLELHIAPKALQARMEQIAKLSTPRIERIWRQYSEHPQRLARAVRLLRSMNGFGAADEFYDGVEVQETFEKDFRPVEGDERFTPVMLLLVLSLYFQLTPATMVAETPEVVELAKLMGLHPDDVVEALEVFQLCDPYLGRMDISLSPLLVPCQQLWQQHADDIEALSALADELKAYFNA